MYRMAEAVENRMKLRRKNFNRIRFNLSFVQFPKDVLSDPKVQSGAKTVNQITGSTFADVQINS